MQPPVEKTHAEQYAAIEEHNKKRREQALAVLREKEKLEKAAKTTRPK